MKILYAIQGTGNGHISRARDVIPALQSFGSVDILLSGTECEVELPWKIKYRFHGLCFVFGKKGGIDYIETFKRGSVKRLFKEIGQLDVRAYDVVISDFEPVSAWACYLQRVPCVGLSHQLAVLNKNAPKPSNNDLVGKAFLKYYAPATHRFGFHFQPYDKNIFSPVIRREIRKMVPSNDGHYVVYLPAYSEKKLLAFLSRFPLVKWEVFSKRTKKPYEAGHIQVNPVSNEKFVESFRTAEGILCGAGFETPAEALYLGKKLMVIPMKGQFEQLCNAAALASMEVPVLKNLKTKHGRKVREWLAAPQPAPVIFPDETDLIIQSIVEEFLHTAGPNIIRARKVEKASEFREKMLSKIFFKKKKLSYDEGVTVWK